MRVQLTETVLRDANQSLIATRLPYSVYEPILSTMDKAGYYSIECWGGATFDTCLRYLGEDPWERLRGLRKHLPNSRLPSKCCCAVRICWAISIIPTLLWKSSWS